MPINETKNIEVDDYFISVTPNKSGNHFRWKVNKFGKTTRLTSIRTEKLSSEILKKMVRERPWAKDQLEARLRAVGAINLLS